MIANQSRLARIVSSLDCGAHDCYRSVATVVIEPMYRTRRHGRFHDSDTRYRCGFRALFGRKKKKE